MEHLDDLRASLFEFQKIGYLTDMKIVTFDGSVSAHRAIIFGYLPEEVKHVFGAEFLHDQVIVLVPDVKIDAVKNAITKAYLNADASALVKEIFQSGFRSGSSISIVNHEQQIKFSNGISLGDGAPMSVKKTSIEKVKVEVEVPKKESGCEDIYEPLEIDSIKDELIKVEEDIVSEDDHRENSENGMLVGENEGVKKKKNIPECPICFKRLTTKHGLKGHLPRKHGTEGTRMLKILGLVKRNKGEKKEKKLSECPICFKRLTASYMEVHMTVHTGGGLDRLATCDICGIQVFNKNTLKTHIMTIHTKLKPHKCKDCNYECVTRGQLNRHRKSLHNTEPKLPCSICGKLLPHEQALKIHEKIVHMETRTFQCPQCQMMFKRNFDVKSHMKNVHSNEFHCCDICEKTFASLEYLAFHLKSHNENKPNKCDQCPKSFVTKHKLKEHIYKHTGEKPYICPLCSSAFNSSGALSRHKRFVNCQLKAH